MPFPPPIHGILKGPGSGDHLPETARSTPLELSAGAASTQLLKRKSNQIEDAETRPQTSRFSPPLEHELVGNNSSAQDYNRARDGISRSTAIAIEERNSSALASRSSSVKDKALHSASIQASRHQSPSTEAAKNDGKTMQSRHDIPQLSEKERKYLLVCIAKVDAMLARERWNLVAEAMKLGGSDTYPGALLEKEYQRLVGEDNDAVKPTNQISTVPPQARNSIPSEAQYLKTITPVPPTLQIPNNEAQDPRAMHLQPPVNKYQGFGILFNRGPLQYSPQELPENVRARMAQQDIRPQTQSMSPIHSPRPEASFVGPKLNPVNEPFSQPATEKPLSYEQPTNTSDQHEPTLAEKSVSIIEASIPSIQYTSTGAPTFVASPAPSTLALDRTTYVSPYDSRGSPAEPPHTPVAFDVEARTPIATRPNTGTSFVSVNGSRDNGHGGQSSGVGALDAGALPSSTPNTFVSVNGAHSESHDNQNSDTQRRYEVAEATTSVFTPQTSGKSFITSDQSLAEKEATQGSDHQPAFIPTKTPASIATPPNSGTTFVSVNESSQEKAVTDSPNMVKWEENDTRSRPRLANEKVSALEREYQQDPRPTKEYKEELAKTLDTTFFKINNWFSNRRSKATTQAKQARVLYEARRNSSTVDPSPIESSRAVSTPVTEATPETEHAHYSSHAGQASTKALKPIKSEPLEVAETPPQRRTPSTPSPQRDSIADRGFQNSNPIHDTHETRSSAMKAAWARRKAAGRNGRDGGAPKHSTAFQPSLIGSSPVAFANQILAAAEQAQNSASPTPPTQDSDTLTTPSPSQATFERSSAAITASSNSGDKAYSQLGKKRGPYKKRNVSGLAAPQVYSPSSQLQSPPLGGPSSPYGFPRHAYIASKSPEATTANLVSNPHTCEKCGKSYQQFAGLKYHKEHHPNCESEPPKLDIRTNPAEKVEASRRMQEARRASGARPKSADAWTAVNRTN